MDGSASLYEFACPIVGSGVWRDDLPCGRRLVLALRLRLRSAGAHSGAMRATLLPSPRVAICDRVGSKSGRRTPSLVWEGRKDITLAELRLALAEMGLPVSVAGLHRFFARRGMTRKKRLAMLLSGTGPTS